MIENCKEMKIRSRERERMDGRKDKLVNREYESRKTERISKKEGVM